MNKYKRKDYRRLSNIYDSMKQRCLYEKSKSFKYYKDIEICKEWIHSFDNFCKWSIDNGYSENLTLDRIDNSMGYCPENCRWVDMKTQCNNRRNNRMVIYKGKEYTLSDLETILNICQKKIRTNIERGYNIEDIIKMNTYLKISEVSNILNISKRQLYTLHKNKKLIPDFISKGGDRYYKIENIKKYKGGEVC